ncbi:Myo-inositol-1-phosphate synthase [Caldalkalibacillus thermarum TA2.A1]|uniref:Inositol-3-phosphate synthase n=1 Tax=Caldalkalibacillus thermarum (strain TA2.A1) TaxID=986075 RepID=F5L8E8_CALTT|nr:inositol-3-phosphate synthase [Caldalkalibacillus thermarum]EGL82381.1 Myo-inositol-1-phosphate synthase [Caldalkalibacillus thermarum TA2.A1]QZT34257.1 inositol-3-phosphate synthase [Caldalkalibacillus thermarum TA2.A1]
MGKINIAIAGVGNCASALLQGIEMYKNTPDNTIGLMNYDLGGYKPGDINVVAAFDVDKRKVGKPLKEAIFAEPNCTTVFYENLPDYPVKVHMGPVLDGVSELMAEDDEDKAFIVADEEPCDVAKVLKESGADMLICYLPVGSEEAVRYYAEACLEANVGFINAIPVFIASDEKWAKKFEEKNLPIIGDDIKSQVGATIVHRTLTKLFENRGVVLDRTYQLNFGGNTDFLNMLNRSRLKSKKKSKTQSVQSELKTPLDKHNIHIGPSDYIPWLNDNKIAYIRMEGRGFGNVPLTLEVKLSVEDSPNSAGSMIDAIRCMKLALDRKIGGVLTSISSYTMKSPPVQYTDTESKKMVQEFIDGRRER